LIIGARGQDGTLLAEYLVGLGYQVVGIARPGSGALPAVPAAQRIIEADVRDSALLRSLLLEIVPDEIYHLAAFHYSTQDNTQHGDLRSKQAMVDTNFSSTAALAFAVLETGLRSQLVFAASSQMYTATQMIHVIDETSLRRPNTFYGHTKSWSVDLLAQLRREAGLRACTAILFNHDSPLRRATFVSRKISQAAAAAKLGERVPLNLLNIGARVDWSSARDVVRALHLIATSTDPSDFVVASGQLHSVRDMLDIAFGHVGLDWRECTTFCSDCEEPALCGNSARLEATLGWTRAYAFSDMIVEMVDADLSGARTVPYRPDTVNRARHP
jgi:GDPmannose 4,6-dehydratase